MGVSRAVLIGPSAVCCFRDLRLGSFDRDFFGHLIGQTG